MSIFHFIRSLNNKEGKKLFGVLKLGDRLIPLRFVIHKEHHVTTMEFAPYGSVPERTRDFEMNKFCIRFFWTYCGYEYTCSLHRNNAVRHLEYTGKCYGKDQKIYDIILREFMDEDNRLQGKYFSPTITDLIIIERARTLLNEGKNWKRTDNRVCNNNQYPDKLSLFCALYKASLETEPEYLHRRPAMEAIRQAIHEIHPKFKYRHSIMALNNHAESFDEIDAMLQRGMEIIKKKLDHC
jgi:hypothetical protein